MRGIKKELGRLPLAFGVAATVHGAAIFGPELLRHGAEKPKIAEQVVHEEIRPSEQEKKQNQKPNADSLKETRKQYITELLSMVPEIIERLSANGNKKFDYYRKEEICARYKEAIETRALNELSEYFPFNFCTELCDSLKSRYL